jgi:ketosteroid isomerase-like protein
VNRFLLATSLGSFVVAAAVACGGCQSTGDRAASASSAGGSAGAAGSASADVPSVAADLVEQHCNAQRKKDFAALEKLWADDFTFVNPRGQVLSKADRLKNVRTGATGFKTLTCDEVKTHSWGKDWAVTTIRAVIEGQYSGQEGSGNYRCTFFWAQPHGRWQLVALQMTRIEK